MGRLPTGYRELEYIQSSGGQYIDTGIVPNPTDNVSIRRKHLGTSSTTSAYFGCMPSSYSTIPRFAFGKYSDGGAKNFAGFNITQIIGNVDTEWHTDRIFYNNSTYYVQRDNETAISYTPQTQTAPTLSAYIFARHGTNGVQVYDGEGTAISFIDWKDVNGNQRAYFVPAKNSSNVLGMYDINNSGKNLIDIKPQIAGQLSQQNFVIPAGTYTLSGDVSQDFTYTSSVWNWRIIAGDTKTLKVYNDFTPGTRNSVTFTINQESTLAIRITSVVTAGSITNLMLEQGSTATAYEPFPFYTNQGTGSFIAGPEVYDAVANIYKQEIPIPRLPSGYQEVEYLEVVGTGTAAGTIYYIDTGVACSLDMEVETNIKHIGTGNNLLTPYAIGRNSSAAGIALSHYNQGPNWAVKFSSSWTNNGNIVKDTWHHIVHNKDEFILNGTSSALTNSSTGTTNLYLMCDLWSTAIITTTKLQMKNFIIRKSGVVVFNGIACKDNSTNKYGFYDTISGTFKGNAGTGTFTAGDPVYHKVTTYKTLIPYYPSSDIEGNSTQATTPTPSAMVPVVNVQPYDLKGVGTYKDNYYANEVPSGYTRLEYLQSSGTSNIIPYIDTLFIPTKNSKARVKFSPVQINGTGFFGSRLDSVNARFCGTTFTYGSTFAFAMTNNTWSNNKTTVTAGNIYDCIAYNGKQIINGTEYTEATVTTFNTTSTFKLAPIDRDGLPTGGAGSSVNTKFYLCQLWENNVLVFDGVPAKNSSNVLGMYDLVSGQFFTNAGTGDFIAGPEITGTPTIIRKVEKVIFDGSENWQNLTGYMSIAKTDLGTNSIVLPYDSLNIKCSHFTTKSGTFTNGIGVDNSYVNFKYDSIFTTLSDWQSYLAKQAANGTPVTVYFPLANTVVEQPNMAVININKKSLIY